MSVTRLGCILYISVYLSWRHTIHTGSFGQRFIASSRNENCVDLITNKKEVSSSLYRLFSKPNCLSARVESYGSHADSSYLDSFLPSDQDVNSAHRRIAGIPSSF